MTQYYHQALSTSQRIGRGEVTVITGKFATVEVTEPLNATHLQAMHEWGYRQMFPPVLGKENGSNSNDVLIYNFEKIGD